MGRCWYGREPGRRAVRGACFVLAYAAGALVGTAMRSSHAAPPATGGLVFAFAIAGPSPLPYASTSLGRARHRLRVTATNPSAAPVPLGPALFHYVAQRDGVAYACERNDDVERPPLLVEGGKSVTFDRAMTCETALPGDYEVRVRQAPEGDVVARFTLSIGAGANAPVRLPWEPRWYAAAAATSGVAPSAQPVTGARVVVAIVNGSRDVTSLGPHEVRLRTTAHDSGERACSEQVVALEPSGDLAPGRVHSTWLTLRCALPSEGVYDIAVSIASGHHAPIPIATLALRVRSGPIVPLTW